MDPSSANDYKYSLTSFFIGLGLALLSSIFIGSSFVLKKIALKKFQTTSSSRASAGGYGYLKQSVWWLGLIMMGLGEAFNLLAYAFAPAALVTPLGALSVIVSSILSSKFLDEKLNLIRKIGCFLCILGSLVFIIHSPKCEEIESFSEIIDKLGDSMFLLYVGTIIFMNVFIKIIFVPRFGNTNVVVYLLMCSTVGSLTVVFCKALALGVKETINSDINVFAQSIFWFLLSTSIVCIIIQMNYLNKSLDIFSTNIVTPVYYVMFTILVLFASSILFKEWEHMLGQDIIGCLCGFCIVITAVFMLNVFKDVQISFKEYRKLNNRLHINER